MNADAGKDFLGALDELWDYYRDRFRAGRGGISEESIHDLRVAARKFLALLDIVRGLAPRPRVNRLRLFFKKQLDELDDLHDGQVMLAEAAERVEELPQMEPFRAYLEKRAGSLARAARKNIRASKPSDLKGRVKILRAVAEEHASDVRFGERLLQSVDDAHRSVEQACAELSASDPATIHRVRVAFKKFRYMIELLQPVLPDYPQDYLERMHAHQDAMGKVHDTTVFLDGLQKFEKEHARQAHAHKNGSDTTAIERYYQKRLSALIRGYFERKDEFEMFWRAAPDQPFPWEHSDDPLHSTPRDRRATQQQQQRAGGQPAAAHRRRKQKDAAHRQWAEGTGSAVGPDPDEPLSSGG